MSIPDWQLPPGVTRGLWDALHDREMAQGYDQALAGTPLLETDLRFAQEYLPARGRLIDLGCGTGRLLIPFAQRGAWCLGVDLSAEMIRVTASKAATAGVEVHLVQANLVELNGIADDSFDAAACLFSTLGMVIGAENRRRVLAHAFRVLRPRGRLVLHVHNRWFNFWDPEGRKWLRGDLVRSLLNRPGQGDRLMPAHRSGTGITLHLFDRREVIGLLRSVGFRLLEVRPVSLRADGRLPAPWWFERLRTYGYLIATEKP